MVEKIRVLLVEPMEKPRMVEFERGLENMQETVGGLIQAIYPFEDHVAIVCDDEAKLKGSLPNRALLDDQGEPYDIICGSFFLCGIGMDDFISLSDELAEKYMEVFKWPELLVRAADGHVFWMKIGSGQPPRCVF